MVFDLMTTLNFMDKQNFLFRSLLNLNLWPKRKFFENLLNLGHK